MGRHLFPTNTSQAEPYQKPPSGGGQPKLPERERGEHGQFILGELAKVADQIGQNQDELVYLQFTGEPDKGFAFERLESSQDKRELVSIQKEREADQEVISATVLVDPKKLPKLTQKVEDYLNKDRPGNPGQPTNQELVESISSIRIAPLHSLLVGTTNIVDVHEIRG